MTTATDFSTLTGTYNFDPAHTRIGFSARHAMVTKVSGAFNEFEGSATLDGANPSNSSATLTVQAASVDTRQPQRDEHLRSSDFFELETYPTITFKSTAVTHKGGNDFEVTGDLTIKATTKSITIPIEFTGAAKDPFGNDRIGFEGETSLLRSEYGIEFNAVLETGGVLVSDKINLEFEISAIKSA
ncbi:MAG TPA: YceI family protein [Jatrophihabitans sp.]|jgi:polyisoprenoid-binding protein YceI